MLASTILNSMCPAIAEQANREQLQALGSPRLVTVINKSTEAPRPEDEADRRYPRRFR